MIFMENSRPRLFFLFIAMSKLAKPTKGEYRRNLPHLQADDKTQFVTFATFKRWRLPESVRGLVLNHCLHDHGKKIQMHGAVVMPDHVHLIFTQLRDLSGNIFGLAEIMNGIKGASSHSVNKALNAEARYGCMNHLTAFCGQMKTYIKK
jgi:REP element-mobilizing transposase RayT